MDSSAYDVNLRNVLYRVDEIAWFMLNYCTSVVRLLSIIFFIKVSDVMLNYGGSSSSFYCPLGLSIMVILLFLADGDGASRSQDPSFDMIRERLLKIILGRFSGLRMGDVLLYLSVRLLDQFMNSRGLQLNGF